MSDTIVTERRGGAGAPAVRRITQTMPTLPSSVVVKPCAAPYVNHLNTLNLCAACSEPSLLTSMTDLMHEVWPQANAQAPSSEREHINWVSFVHADLSGLLHVPLFCTFVHTDTRYTTQLANSAAALVVCVGLAKGYQLWALMADGDCHQLLSDRQGSVHLLRVLPTPTAACECTRSRTRALWGTGFDGADTDAYDAMRPLVVFTDASSSLTRHTLSNTLTFVSVRTGKQVHSVQMDGGVLDVHASRSLLAVCLMHGRVCILDAMTFTQRYTLDNCQTLDADTPVPIYLGDTWLALAVGKLDTQYQSCGGIVVSDSNSVTSQMMSAAKSLTKGVSVLSESVLGSSTRGGRAVDATGSEPMGVVSLINLVRLDPTLGAAVDLNNSTQLALPGVLLAHFVALHNERCVRLQMTADSSLLAVTGTGGACVHLYRLLVHATDVHQTAVHHLYTCARGQTPARIIDLAFANDGRWLAATSNHGTTHVFALCPYGGAVSLRTHGSTTVVNKDSGFVKSAGLIESSGTSAPTSGSPHSRSGSPRLAKDTHPLMFGELNAVRASNDPRLPPYPSPTLIYAAHKIHQQTLANLSSRAVDLSVQAGAQAAADVRGEIQTRAHFAPIAGAQRSILQHNANKIGSVVHDECLYVLNSDGQLTEHAVAVSSALPHTHAKYKAETPIRLTLSPLRQWTMHRTRSSPDIRPPFASTGDNALVHAAHVVRAEQQLRLARRQPTTQRVAPPAAFKADQRVWLTQIEMRTYSGPARRIWLGPQFTFKTYNDSEKLIAVTDDAAGMNDNIGITGKRVNGKKAKKFVPASSPAATRHSEPIACLPGRSVPVVIDAASAVPRSMDGATHVSVVCGSWSDNDYISCDESEMRVRDFIADAMTVAPVRVIDKRMTSVCSTQKQLGDAESGDINEGTMEDARSEFSSQSSADSDGR